MPNDPVRNSIVAYCAAIGADPLLVQGAGGNVSWKNGDTLWIKASGTWLAEAAQKDIFVPVDLNALRLELGAGKFSALPTVLGGSTLRPSIETLLHALMPQPVVVHLHAIEVLAHLVRVNWVDELRTLLGPDIRWATVPYKKPGAELAEEVSQALAGTDASVVFLQSHGVVIGAERIDQVSAILSAMTAALRTAPLALAGDVLGAENVAVGQVHYSCVTDETVRQLAFNPDLFAHLADSWALYPDHVVFLGAAAITFDSIATMVTTLAHETELPELVFVEQAGVFIKDGFSLAKQVQLRCYADVMVRQHQHGHLNSLTALQVGELLNWDAEQYRMRLSKQ